jgi:CubicO group peptidase (beta-lactamase class C family)
MSVPPLPSLDLLDVRLRAACDAYLAASRTPGASIAIVSGDRGYHYAYGVKSSSTGEPVSATTGFNIGSCSKAFVSATLASLVADGLVAWDDPITRYVPEFAIYDAALTERVTLRDLSANRLGLPRVGLTEYGMDPSFPAEHTLARLRYTEPIHPLRDRFTYVNSGHTANAVAVGRITGTSFLATLHERILEPLGMTSTSGGAAARDELADRAGWHVIRNGEVTPIEPVFTDAHFGSGSMVVCGRDALQWLRFQLGGGTVDGVAVIARGALGETHRPHSAAQPGRDVVSLFYPDAWMGSYALGWAVSDFEGHPLVAHSGSDLGCTAMTLLFPRAGLGIAVYGNAADRVTLQLAYALAAIMLGVPSRDWRADFDRATARANPPPPETIVGYEPLTLDGYAGTYSHPADGPLVIERSGETLRGSLLHGYKWSFTLDPVGPHRFAVRFVEPDWQSEAVSILEFVAPDGDDASRVDLIHLERARTFAREA